MTNLLLDTHIALWLDSGDERLGTPSRRTIEAAWAGGDRLFFSAVSVWEIAVLVDKGLIDSISLAAWVDRFVGRPGMEAVALDHKTAALAYNLGDLDHRDPADRLLIATAIGLGCPLITHDHRIRRFAQGRGKQLGFTVA